MPRYVNKYLAIAFHDTAMGQVVEEGTECLLNIVLISNCDILLNVHEEAKRQQSGCLLARLALFCDLR